jgi:pectinesterase inhibitor-like protein
LAIHHHSVLLLSSSKRERDDRSREMTRRQHVVALLLLLVVATACAGGSQAKRPSDDEAAVSPVAAADFVRRSCRSTRYPGVCESTLLPCAGAVGRSPRRLARAALVVGADRASNWSSYIRGSRGDCAEMARMAEAQLRQSASEMERMGRAGRPRFAWHLSNVQTWASAALTDADTCLDSLGNDRDAVRTRVLAVAQATSNALALVNKLDPAPHRRRRLLLL